MAEMERLNYAALAPEATKAMRAFQGAQTHSSLDPKLKELVKIRASQINGCAYCLDMHTKDARAIGESEQRIFTLPAWREAPFYTAKERAALAWTEILTRLADIHIPEEARAAVRAHFSDQEVVDLTYAIATINTWNRLMVAFEAEVGSYKPELAR